MKKDMEFNSIKWKIKYLVNLLILFLLGPGTYLKKKSDFAKLMASKILGDEGTYLINDNGHINLRSQSYMSLSKMM